MVTMMRKNRWSLLPDIGLPSYVLLVAIGMWLVVSVGLVWALKLSFDALLYGAGGGACSLHYIGKRLAGKSVLIDTNLEVSGDSPFHVRFFSDLLFLILLPGSLCILLRG
jgi:hypothetical protein